MMKLNKNHINAIAIMIAMALSWFCVRAEKPEPLNNANSYANTDSLTVSLITCYPGPEIYELCGHEAIRVRGEGRDSVWNFGMFSFNEPNFIYRFVKGETDYLCVGYPFEWFLPEYVDRGSKVVEQDLNLTQEEAKKLLGILQTHALPKNRRYRYNYVLDNCATRITDQLDKAASSRIIYPDTLSFPTFRQEMRNYHKNYPWYQFGIDLALGSGLDRPLQGREDMFVPVEMMKKSAGAHFFDGRQLVREERILNEGRESAVLPPTPWWLTPLFIGWVVAVLSVIFSILSLRKNQLYKWGYFSWFFILGLGGCMVTFLVFVSSHEATSPNSLLLWLNPLQLIFAVCVLWRRLRRGAIMMSWYNIVAMVCMLLAWPFQRQVANPAFFPLMISTLILSSTYAIIAYKDSYNNNGVYSSRKKTS
ncbi:MAG: DUF4105 domain-containing protein [Bacteroides sp.]|nr:DUF4105 domain-containing protein [Bacteroides sp.]